MWLITRVWDNAGAITLVQVIGLALVLGLVARRLVELGAPAWSAVGAAWLVGALPAVGPTTISVWKDVAFTLAFLWAFAELLQIARLRDAYWSDARNPIRLGAALSLIWLYRHNGVLTSLVVVAVLAVLNRRRLSRLVPAVLTLLGIVLIVQGPVFWLFSVDRGGKPAAAEVLIPLVASSFVHEPGNFRRIRGVSCWLPSPRSRCGSPGTTATQPTSCSSPPNWTSRSSAAIPGPSSGSGCGRSCGISIPASVSSGAGPPICSSHPSRTMPICTAPHSPSPRTRPA